MRRNLAILGASAVALSLTACAAQPRMGPPNKVIDAVLRTAPGIAQPSTIVATEVAFGRLSKDVTQDAAFLQYAASGAQVHLPSGIVPVSQWAGQAGRTAGATRWQTRAVAISCDGALAASVGRYSDAAGIVGDYVMIWQRESDNSYRWLYHAAGPDVPQPPPRKAPEQGDIVVTALDAVQGLVASCPRGGDAIPAPPALSLADDLADNAALSRDGTLRWRWEERPGERRFVAADYFYEGRWLKAFELNLAAGLKR